MARTIDFFSFFFQSRIANASAEAIKEVHGKEYTPGQIAKVICKL